MSKITGKVSFSNSAYHERRNIMKKAMSLMVFAVCVFQSSLVFSQDIDVRSYMFTSPLGSYDVGDRAEVCFSFCVYGSDVSRCGVTISNNIRYNGSMVADVESSNNNSEGCYELCDEMRIDGEGPYQIRGCIGAGSLNGGCGYQNCIDDRWDNEEFYVSIDGSSSNCDAEDDLEISDDTFPSSVDVGDTVSGYIDVTNESNDCEYDYTKADVDFSGASVDEIEDHDGDNGNFSTNDEDRFGPFEFVAEQAGRVELEIDIYIDGRYEPADGSVYIDVEDDSCSNECSPNARECTDSNHYRLCNYADGCYRWYGPFECQPNQTCNYSTANCESTCNNQCSPYENQCTDDTHYKSCEEQNGCWVWSSVRTCSSGTSCNYGVCRSTCQCSSGSCCSDGCHRDSSSRVCSIRTEKRCEGSACGDDVEERTRSQYCSGNSSSCTGAVTYTTWQDTTYCGETQKCSSTSYNCYESLSCLSDECFSGQTRCLDSSTRQSCIQSSGRWVWGDNQSCHCNNGECCMSECAIFGQTRCLDSGTEQTCGNFDSDSCLEWGDSTGCNCQDDSCCDCLSGVCCSDNCHYDSEYTRCAQSSERRCGNVSCGGSVQQKITYTYCSNRSSQCGGREENLDWQTITTCLDNQVCDLSTLRCVDSPICCENDCRIGQTRCLDSNTKQTCGDYDSDNCYEWGENVSCPCSDNLCRGCQPNWICSNWTCENNDRIRNCYDYNECGVDEGRPVEYQDCPSRCSGSTCVGCLPDHDHKVCLGNSLVWQDACDNNTEVIEVCSDREPICSDTYTAIWSNGFCSSQDLVCYYADETPCSNGCQNDECQECSPNWQCSEWECHNNNLFRDCIDQSDCSNEEGHPSEFQGCQYGCEGTQCIGQLACEIEDVHWNKAYAVDDELLQIEIQTNGHCDGQIFTLEIWDEDLIWILDDFLTAFEIEISGMSMSFEWNAVFIRETTNPFDFCEMHGGYSACFQGPEYYVKIIQNGNTLISTEDSSLVNVSPFYMGMSMDQYLLEQKLEIQEMLRRDEQVEYYKCVNSQETINDHCREVLKRAGLQSVSEEISDFTASVGLWWNKGLRYFDLGVVFMIAAGCGGCQFSGGLGSFMFEPLHLDRVIHGGIYDNEWQYPLSVIGPDACEFCANGIWNLFDNPQVDAITLVWGIGKSVLLGGVKNTAKISGLQTFEYFLDEGGLGARMTYEIGEDTFQKMITYELDDLGQVALRQVKYMNPVTLYSGGKEFVLFNALRSAPFIEVSSLSKASKRLFAGGIENGMIDGAYLAMENLARTIPNSGFQGVKIQLKNTLPGNLLGSYYQDGASRIIKLRVGELGLHHANDIADLELLVQVFEHELGHYFQEIVLTHKGFSIVRQTSDNYAVEFFNDMFMLRNSHNEQVYKNVLRSRLRDWENGLQSGQAQTRLMNQFEIDFVSNYPEKFQLLKARNLAIELEENSVQELIEEMVQRYSPDIYDSFISQSDEMLVDFVKYSREMNADSVTSTFTKIVNKYKLNHWPESGGGSSIRKDNSGTGAVLLVDTGKIINEIDSWQHLGCFENNVWMVDVRFDRPIERIEECEQISGDWRMVCVDGECRMPQDVGLPYYKSCHQNNVWLHSSSGDPVSLVMECLENIQVCMDGGCRDSYIKKDFSENLDIMSFQLTKSGCKVVLSFFILADDVNEIDSCEVSFGDGVVVDCQYERAASMSGGYYFVEHNYQRDGEYQITLEVNDSDAGSIRYVIELSINDCLATVGEQPEIRNVDSVKFEENYYEKSSVSITFEARDLDSDVDDLEVSFENDFESEVEWRRIKREGLDDGWYKYHFWKYIPCGNQGKQEITVKVEDPEKNSVSAGVEFWIDPSTRCDDSMCGALQFSFLSILFSLFYLSRRRREI